MISKGKIALIGTTVAIGLVLPFAQAVVAPFSYNILWTVFIAVALVVIAASLGLPQLLLGKDREWLDRLHSEHPGAAAELVAVWSERTPGPTPATLC